ncbi:hypothetical protein PQ467_08850 [Novosphingobium sp. KACC 22771]|nr:serine hydrolase [Novosphingobium sp. KACC 22771]WDF70956.1 hypothetical protein PQ467_08850 [Novosphingobium sp. KACC 22771]
MGDRDRRLYNTEPLLNITQTGGLRDHADGNGRNSALLVLGQVLSNDSREHLRNRMIGCQTGADRPRAGLPGNWVIADKTGDNGADAAGT